MLRALLAVALLAVIPAQAQEWPTKPVRMIVPFPPGGGTDTVARPLAAKLAQILGQQVVIDNRGGAGGTIGAAAQRRRRRTATRCCCTRCTAPSPPRRTRRCPTTCRRISFRSPRRRSFPTCSSPRVACRRRPCRSSIAWAKANPGKLNCGSAGNGTSRHLSCELFNAAAGVNATHVPYKGTGPAMQALIAGEIDWIFEALGSAAGQIRAGTIRPIVVTSAQRSPAFPEIPTAIESGLAGFEITSWYGLWVPVGTPAPIVQKLHDAVVKAFADPELKETWAKLGAEPGGSSAEAFRALIDKEVAKWGKVVRDAKITLD